jgi:Flp pilus assembly protein TadG
MLLELALVLPFLILLLLLVLECTQLVRTHVVLNNAAREGARLSVLKEHEGGIADIKTQVVAYAAQNHVTITTADVTVNQGVSVPMPTGYGAITASKVTANTTYTLNYLKAFAWFGVPATYTLQGAAEFRNLY